MIVTTTYTLGIEIGGTKIQVGVGAGTGAVGPFLRQQVDPSRGSGGILEQLSSMVPEVIAQARAAGMTPVAVGVGFGGPVDGEAGIVRVSHQVAGWENMPLARLLADRLQMPVFLGNDADLAGWAEATVGAGAGESPVVYMNIGSGIGGALCLKGELYDAHGAGAVEIGHLRFCPPSLPDRSMPPGPWPTLEDLCSGWGIANRARQGAAADPRAGACLLNLAGGRVEKITTEMVVQAARERDSFAEEIWRQTIEWLGVAVANVITLFNPRLFVIGGGVGEVGPFLLDPLAEAVHRQSFAPFRGRCQLVKARLGEEVVVHGAIGLALSRVGREQGKAHG